MEQTIFFLSCSRFVYGEEITEEKIYMIDKAEQFLLNLGFHQVRVRLHNKIARIEVLPKEFLMLIDDNNRFKILEEFEKIGFIYTSMDLRGYKTGSMNKIIESR